jgi:membrane protease YdiL (CAAX protease family)
VRFAEFLAFGGLILSSVVGVVWPMVRGVPAGRVRHDLGLHRGRGVFREVASGVAGYAAVLPIFAVGFLATLALMALWTAITPTEAGGPVSHPVIEMIAEGDVAVRLTMLFLAAGFAPFFEETLFRGALYGDLRRRFGPLASGLLMGTLFAAIHPQGLLTVPALAALALGFALLREWRGSLIAPMIAHAIHNGTLIGLTWFLLG